MADTAPQQHAEALEMALAALPPELNALGVYNFDAWTSYVHAANPDAIRSLLDERKRLREALERISKIENMDDGPDWEEIEEARAIAKEALK